MEAVHHLIFWQKLKMPRMDEKNKIYSKIRKREKIWARNLRVREKLKLEARKLKERNLNGREF